MSTLDLTARTFYLIYIAFMSAATFIMYGCDKKKARGHAWRIKEKTLLCFGFLGGALGGIMGMLLFRHKTKHMYFWTVNILSLALHAVLFLYL